MSTLRELIALGFSPALAMVMLAVAVLWGSLCAVVVLFYRTSVKAREETRTRVASLEDAVKQSDHLHAQCKADRDQIARKITGMQQQLRILHACTHRTCPVRDILTKMRDRDTALQTPPT